MREARRLAVLAFALAGAGALWAAKPVARWDVVPYQRVKGVFNAGVVAFHEKGVTVEFTVNGKKAFTAAKPTLNPRTGVCEYVFPFDARKFKDGPVEIGATAKAEGQEPTALDPITLYANGKGTQGSAKTIFVDSVNGNEFQDGTRERPVKSLKRGVARAGDGGTVLLLSGDYPLRMVGGGVGRSFWTTIRPAPG